MREAVLKATCDKGVHQKRLNADSPCGAKEQRKCSGSHLSAIITQSFNAKTCCSCGHDPQSLDLRAGETEETVWFLGGRTAFMDACGRVNDSILLSGPSSPGQEANSSQDNGEDNGPKDSFHHQKDGF